ncbi:MAG TPA: riboflavin synthase [bacterium]
MFTGIVEEIGAVRSLRNEGGSWILAVEAKDSLQGTRLGDSICVNGVCLTVTELMPGACTFGLAPETLARTNLGDLKPGDGVNLERSMAADGRFGGHYMQGHVDGTGTLASRDADGDSLRLAVQAPPALMRYLVPKGYIAIDGTSLTIIDVLKDRFTFMLVAYTQQHIVLPRRTVGSRVNLEVDVMAKYVERLMQAR